MPLAHSTKHYVVEDPEATVRASAISPAVEGAVADTGAEEAPTAWTNFLIVTNILYKKTLYN